MNTRETFGAGDCPRRRACDTIGGVPDVDFSLLDVPRNVPVADAQEFLRTAMAWHFGADSGSPFWLRAAENLPFDPVADINTFEDLRRFPDLVNTLRSVPVEDLIPRGYGWPLPLPQIFESGGSTGAPKRTAQLPDWVEQVTQWQTEDFTVGGFVRGGGFLCLMPSGPHGVSYFSRRICERLGSLFHPIDLDPRWVKKLAIRNGPRGVAGYVEHVIEQARWILQTQNVTNMQTTPPLLEAIARNDVDVDLINQKIRWLLLSGAHVDCDTLDVLRDIFPDTTITMAFGSTMILSQATTRIVETGRSDLAFDPRTPYVVFTVIDPGIGEPVPYGERGQIVMNHISKGMFIPNNVERDTAIRLAGPDGQIGDSVAEVKPVEVFDGGHVVEGVY